MITTVKPSNAFTFKKFTIKQTMCTMKVNTDGVLLGAWAIIKNSKKVLDIGTGTGVIALMIAQRSEQTQILGIDIDENSSIEAQENVSNSPYHDRVEIKHTSIQDYLKTDNDKFDLIISNPPFFTGGTFSANENKANVRHTIKLPHGDLLNSVNQLLDSKGNFGLILPYIEGLRFIELAERSMLYPSHITEVRHRKEKPIERLLINFKKEKTTKIHMEELLIMEEDGQTYTESFKKLTQEFYIHF
ncbi:MAG: hypothetical protein RLZZ546_897 [Bacteroidota bacterium]|jgi:tRNA1Val (adenine37-N6)-methyltransferase